MAGQPTGRILIAVASLMAIAIGCGPTASATPSTAPAGAPSAAASTGGIELDRTGPIGCDSIGVDYTSATIRIDASADPDVWAETNTGKKLVTKWTSGFTASDGSAPLISGPKGEEVARDGTTIDVPPAAYPRLAGYFVCVAPDSLSVLEKDPE